MRASFASSLFESSGDLPLVAWRLRVKNIDTLSHYIHELQAQTFLSLQSEDTRCQIRSLATIAPQVISVSVHFLRSGVSPSLWPGLWPHVILLRYPLMLPPLQTALRVVYAIHGL